MSKYIFLDIDGVLNNNYTKNIAPYGCKGINNNCLNILKTIVNKTNGKIVLISDWLLSFLPDDHMPDMAKYITEKLYSKNLSFELISYDRLYFNRVESIKNWIETHKTEGYIILDDYNYKLYYLDSVYPHWLHINNKKGLRNEHIKEAIEKINIPIQDIILK